jgi:hypothetical protein
MIVGPQEGQGGRVADQAGEALRRTQAPTLRPRRLEVEEGLSRSYLRPLHKLTEPMKIVVFFSVAIGTPVCTNVMAGS